MKSVYSLGTFIIALIAGNAVITPTVCAQCVQAPPGLVAWWGAEGNAQDLIGTNNGTLLGNATYGSGRVGQAFVFDGNGDVVRVGNGTNLQLQNFTVECWIKRASATIASYGSGGVGTLFAGGSGSYQFAIDSAGALYLSKLDVNGTAPVGAVTDTNWHHVALTKLGTNVVFYIDGVGYQAPPYNTIFSFTTPLGIGARGDNLGNSFLGSIDELSVYGRALSSSEIQAIYAAGSAGKCFTCSPTPPGLVSWWRAEGNGQDQIGTNNGTLLPNTSFAPGETGQGLSIGANGGGVDCGAPTSLKLQDFTLEAWIKRGSSTKATWDVWAVAGVISWDWGGFAMELRDGGEIDLSRIGYSAVVSTNTITDTNVFHHIVATKSGSTVVLYIDGVGELMPAYNPGFTFDGSFCIGTRGSTHWVSFLGVIDEARVYNRALTASEVQALYLDGGSGNCFTCPPATATAEVVNGFVVGANIINGGCGYTNTPLVLFQGGGGHGATATAVVSNGVVVDVEIFDAGMGYTNAPTIAIGSAPVIGVQPQSVVVRYGGTASFKVALANITPATYQWFHDGNTIPGATASTLVVSNVIQTNLGSYAVTVVSPFGTTNSSAALLSMYPFLDAPFQGLLTQWGMPAVLSVHALGSEPLSYQWYQNGSAVPNGTNTTLSFGAIQLTNAGIYSVVVKNQYGSATNAPAQVVVNPAGVSLALRPSVTISGAVGYHYIIRRTPDLGNTNAWVTMTNLTLTQPVEIWVDTSVDASLPANPQRFYQVLPGQ